MSWLVASLGEKENLTLSPGVLSDIGKWEWYSVTVYARSMHHSRRRFRQCIGMRHKRNKNWNDLLSNDFMRKYTLGNASCLCWLWVMTIVLHGTTLSCTPMSADVSHKSRMHAQWHDRVCMCWILINTLLTPRPGNINHKTMENGAGEEQQRDLSIPLSCTYRGRRCIYSGSQ